MATSTPPVTAGSEEEETAAITTPRLFYYGISRPQIWIRLRPPPRYDDNICDVWPDGKTLRLLANDDYVPAYRRSLGYTYTTDGILQSSSQEDTFKHVINDLVEKGMNGENGVIVAIGPGITGKAFTLFGAFSKFEYRGAIPRALERIFEIVEERCIDFNYIIRIGVIEVRRERIRDLLTLGPYELQQVGDNGPTGMLLQQIGCAGQGLGLLIRALTVQKNIPREAFALYHTIVYIDIFGESLMLESAPHIIRGRLTFAKIASMPKRAETLPPSPQPIRHPFEGFTEVDGCIYARPVNIVKEEVEAWEPPKKFDICCPSGQVKAGPTGEAISIRCDLSFLEQMFIQARLWREMNSCRVKYHRQERPIPAASQFFRQNKLTHCLQDIIGGEVRIMLHIRPEREYLTGTFAAIRFVERTKCVPQNPELDEKNACMFMFRNPNPAPESSRAEEQGRPDRMVSKENEKKFSVLATYESLWKLWESEEDLDSHKKEKTILSIASSTKAFDKERHTLDKEHRQALDKEHRQALDKEHRQTLDKEQRPEETKEEETEDLVPKLAQLPSQMEILREASKVFQNLAKSSHKKKRRGSKGKKHRDKDKVRKGSDKGFEVVFVKDGKGSLTGEKSGGIHGDENEEEETSQSKAEIESIENSSKSNLPLAVQSSTVIKSLSERKSKADLLGTPPPDAAQPEETEEPALTKGMAWETFLKSEDGLAKFQQLAVKDNEWRHATQEQAEVLHVMDELLSKLNLFQSDLDLIQQERHLRAEEFSQYNTIMITPKEKQIIQEIKTLQLNHYELLDRLKTLRIQVHTTKQLVDGGRYGCENSFDVFCLENYGISFPRDEPEGPNIINPMTNQNVQSVEDIVKHFLEVKRSAEQQAKQLLRFFPKRPPWNPY